MQDARKEWIETLKQYDQLHLFDFWDELNSVERERLIGDIRSIDFKLSRVCSLGREIGGLGGVGSTGRASKSDSIVGHCFA